jgi:hypothetical protein
VSQPASRRAHHTGRAIEKLSSCWTAKTAVLYVWPDRRPTWRTTDVLHPSLPADLTATGRKAWVNKRKASGSEPLMPHVLIAASRHRCRSAGLRAQPSPGPITQRERGQPGSATPSVDYALVRSVPGAYWMRADHRVRCRATMWSAQPGATVARCARLAVMPSLGVRLPCGQRRAAAAGLLARAGSERRRSMGQWPAAEAAL